MIEQINAVRYKCICDNPSCRYEWESDSIPERCSKCKRYTWNRPALRKGHEGAPIEAFGKSQILAAWGREYKINPATIAARIRNHWPVEDAIATAVGIARPDPQEKD